jgi:hypothetical protein
MQRDLTMHIYEVRPRKDRRSFDLISDVLPFGRLGYDTPDNAIGYAMHSSRSHNAVIRVYDEAGNVIETHQPPRAISKSRDGGATIQIRSCGALLFPYGV